MNAVRQPCECGHSFAHHSHFGQYSSCTWCKCSGYHRRWYRRWSDWILHRHK